MSSVFVRTTIKNFISLNAPTEKLCDLTGEFEEMQNFLDQYGLTMNDKWLGIQFIGNDEVPITVGSTNSAGKYRETGGVYIHVVDVAKLGVHDSILLRAENLRNLLRGQRLDKIVIDSVTPPNFEEGATISFEAGFVSCSFILEYRCDKDF